MENRREKVKWADEAEVVTAWREQLAEAAENASLADLLLRHGPRLLERFIAFYQRLRRLSHRKLWRMRRKLGLSVGAAALLLALSGIRVPVALADDITVDGTDCTLADAITAANTDSTTGLCEDVSAGPDTLIIEQDILLHSALPPITSTITIEGGGHTIERDPGASPFRILQVGNESFDGRLTLLEATISGGQTGQGGGGIYNTGLLTVTRSTVSGNTAYDGGGIFNLGEATIEESFVTGNLAQGGEASTGGLGGGIFNVRLPSGSRLAVRESEISGNEAGAGGGIANVAMPYSGETDPQGTGLDRDGVRSGRHGDRAPDRSDPVSLIEARPGLLRDAAEAPVRVEQTADESGATVILEDSIVSGNLAAPTAVDQGQGYGLGGGLLNLSLEATARFTVRKSTISGNVAEGSVEGGVYGAYGYGGGVDNYAYNGGTAELTVDQSTISGNAARGTIEGNGFGHVEGHGGGLRNWAAGSGTARVTINNSTVSGNTAGSRPVAYEEAGLYGYGGGVLNYGYGEASSAEVTISHSTISGNAVEVGDESYFGYGGGLLNVAYGDATAGVTLTHSIVSGNSAPWGNEVVNYGYSGSGDTIQSDGYNLFGHGGESDYEAFDGTFAPTVGSDVNATRDGLAVPLERILDTTLRDNGGDTKTHALVSGSPAVDAGDPDIETLPEHDQRGLGYPRVVNDVVDIGAYELADLPIGGVTMAGGLGGLIRPLLNVLGLTGVLGAAAALLGLLLRRED